MRNSTKTDRDLTQRYNGFYIWMLNEEKIESFNRCVADGIARRTYVGISGFVGLAKVEWIGEY